MTMRCPECHAVAVDDSLQEEGHIKFECGAHYAALDDGGGGASLEPEIAECPRAGDQHLRDVIEALEGLHSAIEDPLAEQAANAIRRLMEHRYSCVVSSIATMETCAARLTDKKTKGHGPASVARYLRHCAENNRRGMPSGRPPETGHA